MNAELTGRRLGVYLLHERVGAGGMGEVYRARDTRLKRDVAIKILPDAFAENADRRARFEREARVLASLNHPNIATIHGIEDGDGLHALVMELVDGETLADRVRRGPLPVSEALAMARQIADALDAAHERGIVHRDLKPANIKVASSGRIKVLDFGLAKAAAGESVEADRSRAATVTLVETQAGLIIGTPGYMSPEQMRGEAVDKRSDIWAFGCVLYEMITGSAAFARQTPSETIGAILERDPDWSLVPATTPAALRNLIKHCLVKDARRRLRDIGDARIQIDEMLLEPSTATAGPSVPNVPRHRPYWLWASGAVAMIALATVGWLLSRGTGTTLAAPAQFTLSFARQSADFAFSTVPAPSPDGRNFVFIGASDKGTASLWIRPIDSASARKLPGTDGAQTPIWSPDGRWIAFYADGRLKKVGIEGGQPQTIAAVPGFQDASWGSAGVIIFRPSNRQPLFRISEAGGEPAPLTQLNAALGENSHRGPTFLPDGRRFLFTSRCAVAANNTLYLGSLDSPELRRVMSAQSKAIYVPAGVERPSALLYYRDGGLVARAFDADRNLLIGEAQTVIADIDYNPAGIGAAFQASADGRMIVARPSGGSGTQLTWFERNGEQTGTFGGSVELLQPRISPKGDRIAFSRPDAKTGNRDVWTIEIARGIAAPLTLNAANDWNPVWSGDGAQIAFGSDRAGRPEAVLYIKKALDAGAEESVLLDAQSSPTDWSRDGHWIAVARESTVDVVSVRDGKTFTLLDGPFRQGGARFSPDAKWVAYMSDETGRFEVFVRPFAGAPGASRDKIQISDSGGDFSVWRADGKELYFMSEDATIHAVPTSALRVDGPVPRPQPLFRACPGGVPHLTPMSGRPWGNAFDTLDGQRFLVNCSNREAQQFTVLMNWSLSVRN
jgi:eukaryotic-like serine/threonine-protein kinase